MKISGFLFLDITKFLLEITLVLKKMFDYAKNFLLQRKKDALKMGNSDNYLR